MSELHYGNWKSPVNRFIPQSGRMLAPPSILPAGDIKNVPQGWQIDLLMNKGDYREVGMSGMSRGYYRFRD